MIRSKSLRKNLEDSILVEHPRFRQMIEKALRSYRKEGGIPIQDLVREVEKAPAGRDR